MIPVTTIPQEIWCMVIEHVRKDTQTILKLCLVSRAFLPEARRALYTQVTLSGIEREVFGRPSKALKFLNTISSNPSLAITVRSFSYYYGRERTSEWWERMNRGLQNMVNLKTFVLEGARLPLATTLFNDCSFQLRDFSWYDHTFPGRMEDPLLREEPIKNFLCTQPQIMKLWVHIGSLKIAPAICPSLETIVGSTRTISNILPGRRSVTKLQVVWQKHYIDAINPAHIKSISEELPHVRTFIFGGPVPRPSLLPFIPYLQNVRTLRLFGHVAPYVESIVPSASPFETFKKELNAISSLPHLRIFIWSPAQVVRADYIHELLSEEDQRVFVTKWTKAIPAFVAAYFARCFPSLGNADCYSRWGRDGKETHVTPDVFMGEGGVDA